MNTIRSIGRFGLLGFVAEDAASLSNDVLSREELPSSLTASSGKAMAMEGVTLVFSIIHSSMNMS